MHDLARISAALRSAPAERAFPAVLVVFVAVAWVLLIMGGR